MKQIRARRWLAVVLTVLVSASAAGLSAGCKPRSLNWRLGVTHGVIIEPTAGRASLGIYRKATDALYGLYGWGGVRKAQDAIWAVGQPPSFTRTFSYRGRSITTSFGTRALRSTTHSLVYDHPGDLRAALVDAHASRSCLALTLISYGGPTRNWTQKQTGCRTGSI